MKVKETKKICSLLKIGQSISSEKSACDRKNNGMYNCFNESEKFLGYLTQREEKNRRWGKCVL